jgi:hypothetical protein
MARPTRTTTEQLRGGMRAAALMRELAKRVGAVNPHQFAGRFDEHTGMDTQASGKWRLNFGCDGHIEAVAVIRFVKLVLRLEVAQLGIGQHGIRPISTQNTMLKTSAKYSIFFL